MRGVLSFRRVVLACAAMVLVATAIPGVAGASSVPAAKKPVSGGQLTIGIAFEVATLDPVRGTIGAASTGGDRMLLVYGSLMTYNSKTGVIAPGLAESATSPDGQVWTLKLRPNLKFTDGTPLDADAVIFNYNRLKDPANTFGGIAQVSQIQKMTAVDATTVEFRLIQPNGSFAMVFTDIGGAMISPTAFKADPAGFGRKPVGAGPFIMKEWVRDQQITFVRNPDYWDKPRPYLDTIVERIIPNRTTMASLLQQGQLDVIHQATTVELKVATDNPKSLTAWDPTKANGDFGMMCNVERVPCTDVRFREALSLAFDMNNAKQVFLPTVDFPAKTLVCPPWGPNSPYCAKDVKVKYDPTKAKKLIDAVKADGINTDITFMFNTDGSAGPGVGEWVQQQLAKIGVNVTLQTVPTASQYVTLKNAHNFQTTIITTPTTIDMSARFYNDWHSSGGTGGGTDNANANNAKLDVALEKGRNSVKLEDRIAGMQDAQRIMAKEFLVMWQFPYVAGNITKPTVHLAPYQTINDYLFRYEQVWVSGTK